MVDLEYLKSILRYDPETGIWIWLVDRGVSVGDEAGWVCEGYIRICIDGYSYRSHILAWFYMTGIWPDNTDIDHIDMDRSNNKWENLRLATRTQNSANRGRNRNNKSGYKGVCWNKRLKKWVAAIQLNGKVKHLGLFNDPRDASDVYEKVARSYYKEFARV